MAYGDLPKEMIEAILGVMKEFGSLKKTERNQHGGYMFAPVDDFYNKISELLPKFGLVITSNEIDSDIIPMTTATTDKNKNVVGEKTTIWIKTKWEFKLHHNGVASEPMYRFSMIPTSGPQTEGIAQSYASKNFMRDIFKVATGEYELDDLPPTEHGIPSKKIERQATKEEAPHNPVTGEVSAAIKLIDKIAEKTNPPPSDGTARSLKDIQFDNAKTFKTGLLRDDATELRVKAIIIEIEEHEKRDELTESQAKVLKAIASARSMIMGAKTIETLVAAGDAIRAVPSDFLKDGKLEAFLKQKEAEISATQLVTT